jgi:hypothetical protein
MNETLKQILSKNSFYKEALSLVKRNSESKVYLVGSFVYRTLIEGNADSLKEIDFIVKELNENVVLSNEWNTKINAFGHISFVKNEYKIDPIQLTKHINIVRKNLSPSIESYLASVPLNIQSIAYDVDEDKLIGTEGIKAIQNKIIKLNNKDHARYSCENFYHYSVEDMILKVANSFGFEYELDK